MYKRDVVKVSESILKICYLFIVRMNDILNDKFVA